MLEYGIVSFQIAFGLIVITNMVLLGWLAGQVSTEQPDLYERLGGHPLVPMPGVVRAQFRWLVFLYSGRYRTELAEPKLRTSAGRFLIWYSATTLPLVGLFVFVFASIVSSGLSAA